LALTKNEQIADFLKELLISMDFDTSEDNQGARRSAMQSGLVKQLSALEVFAHVSPSNMQRLAQLSKLREVRKRHPILVEGLHAQSVYLVLAGIVKVTTRGSQPERLVVGLVGPGELFGLAAFTPTQVIATAAKV
jgi:CRP-like cAMP-binding protein